VGHSLLRLNAAEAVDKSLHGATWGSVVFPGAVEQAESRTEFGVQALGAVPQAR